MHRPTAPAIRIICAPLPVRGSRLVAPPHAEAISWYGPLAAIEAADSTTPPVALEIDPLAAASRQRLRDLIRATHQACPNIDAAIVSGDAPPPHRDLLAEEGIRVILTSHFSDSGRPRRPAPAGWPCRNAQWGLWEVLRHTGPRWQLFGRSLPRARRGTLAAIDLGAYPAAARGRQLAAALHRLSRQSAKGQISMATLADLPHLVTGQASRSGPASILKAA